MTKQFSTQQAMELIFTSLKGYEKVGIPKHRFRKMKYRYKKNQLGLEKQFELIQRWGGTIHQELVWSIPVPV